MGLKYNPLLPSGLDESPDVSGYVPYTGATSNVNIGTNTFIGHAVRSDATDGLLIEASNGTDVGMFGPANTANVTWYGSHIFSLMSGGSVPFFGSNGLLSQDNQNLYWDDTSNRLSIFGSLGSELVTNGSFTGSATGWTVPSGWAYSSNTVVKNSNGTGALVQTISPTKITTEYLLTYTISNWTVGTVTPSYAGWTGTAVSANGTYTERFVAVSTTNSLSFSPSNTSRFTIDNISLKVMAPGSSAYGALNVGGVNVQGSWSNTGPSTTRSITINNEGTNSWVDFRFAGTLRGAMGYNSSGGQDNYASGGNYFAYHSGNAGLTSNSLFSYNYPTAFVHYAGGWFGGKVHAGSASTPTSTLQSSGGLSLKVRRVTTSQTIDDTATHWIGEATTAVCTGTITYSCSHWTNQTDCELRDSHGGCSWFAGNSCSEFNYESGMSSCSGTSGCSVDTSSCGGAYDESSCLSQDDAYGGTCTWDGSDCSLLDEGTCGSTSGCSQNYSDCSSFNDDYTTCIGTSGCSSSSGTDCSAYDGTDQSTCEANSGCTWDGMGNCYMTCSGTYYTSCSGTYYVCNGTYNTGSCSGTYGAACQGTSSCAGIDDSTSCGGEAGCTWATSINLTLPDIATYPGFTCWVYNGSSANNDVNVLPSGTDTVNHTTSYVLSTFKDGAHFAPLRETASCSEFVSSGTCTPTGCSVVNCVWNGSECTGGASCTGIGDESTCNSTFDYCSGTYVTSSNWYVWSKT